MSHPGQPSGGDPTEQVVAYALSRGYLTAAQVAQARAQGAGAPLLPLLRGLLTPAQLAELGTLYQRAAAGASTAGGGSSSAATSRPAAPAPVAARQPGQVGPYVIERELGRGGMGVVSVARHVELGRRVALKQLLAGGALDAVLRERFLREGQAAAKLDHPGLVRVHDVGQSGEGLYLAMDLVEGESLDRRLDREGPQEPKTAAGWVEQAARAIAFAHRQGVLHRDLKPANLLLTPEGVIKVTDFGLARDAAEEHERLTQTGEMLGTPAYMPPEQAGGEHDQVDARADVYALGATLFALLTGAPPFRGDSAVAIVRDVLTEAPPSPSSLRGDIDRDLETIVLKCLAKERFLRYRTAEALADDLARYLRGEPIAARPPTVAQRLASFRRRRPRAVAAGAALVVVGAVAAAVGVRAAQRAAIPPPEVSLVQVPTATRDAAVEVVARVAGAPPFRILVSRWAGTDASGEPAQRFELVAEQAGEVRRRVRLEPGANRVRVEVVDGYGQAGAPAEVAVAVDREAPTLSLQLTSTWIAPEATFAASLSEPGCTLRVGELSWTVDGTAGSVTVPYAALEEHRGFSVEDPAGNRAESALPFWLVRDEADLRQALDEAAAGSQIFLGPGDYTMTDVLGDSKAVARLRRPVVLSGAGPLPEDRIQVDLSDFDAAKETFQGGVLEAQSEVPRLVFDGPKGLWFEAGADDGPFVLRGLQIERPALIEGAGSETNPTLIAASGRLRIEGCRVDTTPIGLSVGGRLRKATVPGRVQPQVVVSDSALIARREPAIRIRAGGSVEVTGSRLVTVAGAGSLGQASSIKNEALDRGTDEVKGLVELRQRGNERSTADTPLRLRGTLVARDSWFLGYPGRGLSVHPGGVATAEGCRFAFNTSFGAYAAGGSLTLRRCTVEGNYRTGIHASRDARITLEDCDVRENGRGESPGIELIWVDPASTLRGCRVVRNRGPGLILQGAYAGPGRPAPTVERVERCRFEGNTVGVWVRGAGPVPFVDCEVVENLGDGVRLEPFVDPTYHGTRLADVLFEGGTIARNGVDPEALAGPGYGVRRDPSAKLRVEGTTFEGNAAQDDFVGE